MQGPNYFHGQRSSNRRWHPSHVTIAWAACVLMLGAAVGMAEEPNHLSLLTRIQLLPVEDERDRTAPPDKGAEASEARFTDWVRHDDEFLSFSYPKDPRVALEVKSPKDPISVAGGPVGTTENSFFRGYRLTFRGETYCLLLLDRKSDFDDGICLCGSVAYEKYLEHHGALYRFSLLENGKIKKIQLLGDGLRLVLFEWTHLPIHQEVYAQIALSVQMRQPPPDLQALRARIERVYGKAGFLEKGMDRSAVVGLLGPPTQEERGMLRYVFQRSHDEPPGSRAEEVTWTIPLKDGLFLGLSPAWERRRWLPPERNSVQWVVAKLKGMPGRSDSVEPATDEELQPLLARVVELLPTVDNRHWSEVCEAARQLARRGVKDPRVLQIVQARYLDRRLFAGAATDVLDQYDRDGSQELFAKRIRLEMDLARRPEALQEQSRFVVGWGPLEELFARLRPTFSQREALIVEAIDHPNANVRVDGYCYCDELPESVARSKLAKGLADPAPEIRGDCARALAERFGSAENLKLLRAQRSRETDESAREAIEEAIKQLE